MKRLFDIVASLGGLIVLSPIFALIWLLIASQNLGSPIFKQIRIGRHRAEFTCYKFRTMMVEAPQGATHDVGADHITTLGQTLRRYKLDELPQLYNVLRGDMSFVGPRPCLPSQADLIEARDKLEVYKARPGITGLAQVNGIDMQDPEKLAGIDAHYLKTRTFSGDLVLIFKTILPTRK